MGVGREGSSEEMRSKQRLLGRVWRGHPGRKCHMSAGAKAWKWEGPEIFQELQKDNCIGGGCSAMCRDLGGCLQGLCGVLDNKESASNAGRVCSLGREDPLEKGMAIHSCILAWRMPWTEEPGRLQSVESQRVRHD